MTTRHISLLLALLCLSPLLTAAGCPLQLGGKTAHHGSWVQDHDKVVTLIQYGAEGATRVAMELYDPNPLLDGMKIEATARCVVHDAENSELLVAPESYLMRCSQGRIERTTQGLGLIINSANSLVNIFGDTHTQDGEEVTIHAIHVQGDTMTVRARDKHGKISSDTFKRVEAARSESFLERFRVNTVEIVEPNPSPSSRRPRDLP